MNMPQDLKNASKINNTGDRYASIKLNSSGDEAIVVDGMERPASTASPAHNEIKSKSLFLSLFINGDKK